MSNHPPQVIKQLPTSIEGRLSKNSSNETIFNSVKGEYEKALKESGYQANLKYNKKNTMKIAKVKNREDAKSFGLTPPSIRMYVHM